MPKKKRQAHRQKFHRHRPIKPVPSGKVLDDAMAILGEREFVFFTREQERILVARMQAGDGVAREALIESSIPWTIQIARSYSDSMILADDFVGAALLGLCEAVDRFNPAFGTRLTTYAYFRVRKRIRELFPLRSVVRVPSNQVGSDPDKQSDKAAAAMRRPVSLVEEWTSDVELAVLGKLAAIEEDKEAKLIRVEQHDRLAAAIATLPARERRIVRMRLNGYTLDQIGRRLGRSRGRVRQLEKRARKKIGEAMGSLDGQVDKGPKRTTEARRARRTDER